MPELEMTKHDVLNQEEMSTFSLNPRIFKWIEHCRNKLNLDIGEMNILDWGCGRGRSVVWLRERGYNAFGTDIDPEPIGNCYKFFASRGLDPDSLISLLDDGEEKKFPNNYFHLSFSEGVFEHVKNLEQVAENLARVTAAGGVGVHFFPAHRHFVEIHLFMPFLHWLPKNRLRKMYISFLLMFGADPAWEELKGKTRQEQAQAYYEYIINKTYYRTPRELTDIFTRHGFKVDFIPLKDFGLEKHPLLAKLVCIKPLRPFLNWAMRNFGQVGLILTKLKD